VELVSAKQKPRWNQLVRQHHYLKNAILVGAQLHYVARYGEQWLALLGWSAPALHLKGRDAWLGWSEAQLRCRRHFLAQNSRFVLLGDRRQFPNLATRALGLCCQRLSQDWLAVHGHPILAVESFVDGQLFRGTAYKAAGWTRLDDTSGYARVAEDFYERHERPKQLWVRALEANALRALSAQTLPPALAAFEKPSPPPRPRLRLPARRLESLVDQLPKQVPDPRGWQGCQHSWRSVLGLIVLAKLCGVRMGQRQIAEFARQLTHPQRRALGCRREPQHPRRCVVPAESTFQRALVAIDLKRFEPLLLHWQNERRPRSAYRH